MSTPRRADYHPPANEIYLTTTFDRGGTKMNRTFKAGVAAAILAAGSAAPVTAGPFEDATSQATLKNARHLVTIRSSATDGP